MITYYKSCSTDDASWDFDAVNLKNINLLIGASGSGKTRFLNTFFNFADFVSKGVNLRSGKWEIIIEKEGNKYDWEFSSISYDRNKYIIKNEILTKTSETTNIDLKLVERDENSFKFMNNTLPKLPKDIASVHLLKEEDTIKPIYDVFSHMMRRRFHKDELDISSIPLGLSHEIVNEFKTNKSTMELFAGNFPVQLKLYLMKQIFPEKYDSALKYYKSVFTFIEEFKFEMAQSNSIIPILLVKEKGVKDWIQYIHLSSGMQKVLLIITDILTLPGECAYLIDEYENSLGVNAIDFLPQFISEFGMDNQFLITTHHPYLINNIPIENWLIFNRKGSKIRIKSGNDYIERFGKSKQSFFNQLLNDSFYNEGTF